MKEAEDKANNESIKAFPDNSYTTEAGIENRNGMTLRDYFAAKVMGSVIINLDDKSIRIMAETSYRMADAMMKARS